MTKIKKQIRENSTNCNFAKSNRSEYMKGHFFFQEEKYPHQFKHNDHTQLDFVEMYWLI